MYTGTFLFLIVLLLAFFLVFYKKDMLSRIFSQKLSGSAQELQGQLEQTADSIIKQMEEKTEQLEFLLTEANEKLAELDKQNRLAEELLDKQVSASQRIDVFLRELQVPQNVYERESKIDTEHSLAKHLSVIAVKGEDVDSVLAATESELLTEREEDVLPTEATLLSGDDRRQLVMAMAEQGYSITEIAKATGVGKGEVILLLQLNKK